MENTNNYNLRPLWDAILEVYKVFAAICDKHGLRYQAAMGTALGAVRHGGFIPWDDDIDIMMPRPDYDRFLEVAELELPNHLKRLIYGNVKKLPDGTEEVVWRHWCTIRDNRENVAREIGIQSNLAIIEGIYIDIFPIDGMPSSNLSFFLWRICRSFLLAGGYSYGKDSPAFLSGLWIRKHVIGRLARVVFPFCRSSEDFFWKVETFGKRRSYSKSKFAGFAYSAIKGEMRQPRFLFNESIIMKFEDITIPIPRDYDLYLRLTFGDWRTLPPEEKRRLGHQVVNPVVQV